jgi:hypothetical protein
MCCRAARKPDSVPGSSRQRLRRAMGPISSSRVPGRDACRPSAPQASPADLHQPLQLRQDLSGTRPRTPGRSPPRSRRRRTGEAPDAGTSWAVLSTSTTLQRDGIGILAPFIWWRAVTEVVTDLRADTQNIAHEVNICERPDTVSATSNYNGSNTLPVNMTNDGVCASHGDGTSEVGFGDSAK